MNSELLTYFSKHKVMAIRQKKLFPLFFIGFAFLSFTCGQLQNSQKFEEIYRSSDIPFSVIRSGVIGFEGLDKRFVFPGLTVDSINHLLLAQLKRVIAKSFDSMSVIVTSGGNLSDRTNESFLLLVTSFDLSESTPHSTYSNGSTIEMSKIKLLNVEWEMQEKSIGKTLFKLKTYVQVVESSQYHAFKEAVASNVKSLMEYLKSDRKSRE